jgi:cell division protein FtsL
MSRTALVLLIMLLASSLYLVQVSYESRRVFAQLDRARSEQRLLDTVYKRLDAERQAQATHLRVEKVARDKLQMRTATPAVTHYVGDGALQPAAGAASASGAPR